MRSKEIDAITIVAFDSVINPDSSFDKVVFSLVPRQKLLIPKVKLHSIRPIR